MGSGCYAESGPLALHWRKVTAGERGLDWESFVATIASLPDDTLWRHNQAGDLPGTGASIDAGKLAKLVNANAGKRGFTYTHKSMTADNRQAIREANKGGFTINLSANNLSHADELSDLDIGPVVVVMPRGATNTLTPAGRKVVICPAETRDDVTCETCQLCARRDRNGIVIGFPAHGSGARKAEAVTKGN
tara:strand:+ start:140 stop:712 length:573 start_codon:yes stop_codon:yes gene_type:complete